MSDFADIELRSDFIAAAFGPTLDSRERLFRFQSLRSFKAAIFLPSLRTVRDERLYGFQEWEQQFDGRWRWNWLATRRSSSTRG